MTAVSNVGTEVDLQIQQGADFTTTLTFTNPDGSAVDLTGSSFAAQIRRDAADITPAASFSFAMSAPASGVVAMSLPDTVSATLYCGPTLGDSLSLYSWDLKHTDAAGSVAIRLWGTVQVFRDITR